MQMNLGSKRRWSTAVVGLAVLATTGCSGEKVTTKSSSELSRYQVRRIALVPFTTLPTPQMRELGDPFFSTPQSVRRSDIAVAVPSNVEPPPRETFKVPGYEAEKITQLFWNRLRTREGITVLAPGESPKASSGNAELVKATPESAAAAIAKRLNADAVLIGQVLVFQERVGSRLGANPPAAVGFEVKVISADGTVLWVGNYYERQRPMTEDMMGFLQRWGAFVTADELAQYGVDEILKEFPFGSPSK
jgi:hypothetical protein